MNRLKTTSNRSIATLATNFLVLLVAVVMTMISPLVTEIAQDFLLDKIRTGFLFTSNFIGFTIFILLGGVASDRWGKKRILSATLIVLTLLLLAFSIATNYLMLCLVILMIGGTLGILESQANAWIAELNPDNPSLHINISQIYFGIGALIGPYGSGLLMNAGWSWRQIYQLTSGLALAIGLFFVAIKVVLPPPSETATIQHYSLKSLARNRLFLLLCLAMFLYTGSEVGAWTWMATFVMEKLQFSIVESSLSVGVFWIAMIIGRMTSTALLSRFKAKQIIIILALASAVATFASGFAATKTQAWIATILIGLFYSALWPLIVAFGSETMKSSSGIVFALLIGSGGIGSSLIPIFMGFLGQEISIQVSMATPAIFFAIIAAIFLIAFRRKMEN